MPFIRLHLACRFRVKLEKICYALKCVFFRGGGIKKSNRGGGIFPLKASLVIVL